MNTVPSLDFGTRLRRQGAKIHDHLFLGANTGLAAILGNPQVVEAHSKYLSDKKVRVDIFALREGGGSTAPSSARSDRRSPRSSRRSRTSSRSSSGRSDSGTPSARGRPTRTRSGSS